MQLIKIIGIFGLIAGVAGQSHAGFKDTLKAAGAAAGGIVNGSAGTDEVDQPPPVAQNTKPILSQLTVEQSQQQIDKVAESNLFTLETLNAQEVFQALISSRGFDFDKVTEEALSVFKKQLSENEKLLAIQHLNDHVWLFFSDKNVYAEVDPEWVSVSPRNGILRIPYGVFSQLGACDEYGRSGEREWSSSVNIGGKPIIASQISSFIDELLRDLLETKQIVEACKNLDVRNVAIKTLPDITDLSGMCGVSGGAAYESVRAAIKPDLATAFAEGCLEKKLVAPILNAHRLVGIEEAGIPFDGELKQFSYNDMTTGFYSFNFVDGRLYYILRDIPDRLTFGKEKMSPHPGANSSGRPLARIGNKFADKHPLILTSMKKYGNPVFLMKPGGKPGNVRWQWENTNGVLFVDFSSGFDERIKVSDEDYQNSYRYTVACDQVKYPVVIQQNKFEIDGAGYGSVSLEKTATFLRYYNKKEFNYTLSSMPSLPTEGQKSYYLAILYDFTGPSAEAARKECEGSVKLIDKDGMTYKPAHVTTCAGDKNTSVFCFNIPKEVTTFAAQIGAYNIGLEPDDLGYYFVSPVDWDSLEKHKPKIGMIMYYSKPVRDYVLAKKEAAEKEGEQLKQQEIKAAEKALNF